MDVKNIVRLLTGRFLITALLIVTQVVWIVLLVLRVINYAEWISTTFRILGILVALFIINKNDVPAYRMGWILIILITPVLGGLLYLLLGDKRPAAGMRIKLVKGAEIHKRLLAQNPEIDRELREKSPRGAGTFEYVSNYGRFPVWKNTSVKYHRLGEEHFADMLGELQRAKRFIFLEYFIIEEGEMWDSILDILIEKAAQGLDVRLIYDDMGCVSRIPSKYNAQIENLGISCIAFNRLVPFFSAVINHRDHRKIMVIDGNVAFTGGVNLADEYINRKVMFGHWKDTGVMLRGDAVWNFTVMFLEMWNSFRQTDEEFDKFRPLRGEFGDLMTDGFIQPFGDTPLDRETVSVNVYLDILSQAKNYVYIFTPYLAISDELQLALCLTAKRGVDVRMVLPGIPDKKIAFRLTRSYYGPLLEAGIVIYEYTPGFFHAKSIVCDDEIAVVGTINMDYRSLYLHFECGVLMFGSCAVAEIKDDALKMFEISRRVYPRERNKGAVLDFLGGLLDSVLRVIATLF